jgi:hypothetical protein
MLDICNVYGYTLQPCTVYVCICNPVIHVYMGGIYQYKVNARSHNTLIIPNNPQYIAIFMYSLIYIVIFNSRTITDGRH